MIERAAAIAAHVGRYAQPGDVVLVMSNGGFDAVHEKILQALAV
jgi:UDP-N-acetylmuramate: L-alanyl-gamma-D-glutamyl-meso-diaminopimelate ligase